MYNPHPSPRESGIKLNLKMPHSIPGPRVTDRMGTSARESRGPSGSILALLTPSIVRSIGEKKAGGTRASAMRSDASIFFPLLTGRDEAGGRRRRLLLHRASWAGEPLPRAV